MSAEGLSLGVWVSGCAAAQKKAPSPPASRASTPPDPRTHTPKLVHAGLAAAVTVPLLVYLATLAPMVSYGGDCGELIAASYSLDVPHPTGYPTYLCLGRLWAYFPLGNIAHRYNLLSAVFAAAACGLTYLCALVICGMVFPSVLAAWLLGMSFALWRQSVIAEVYSANAFWVALLLYVAISWLRTNDLRFAFLAALLIGLGVGVHLSVLFLAPALLLSAFGLVGKERRRSFVFGMLGFFLLGFAVVLYLPMRSATDPPINWGHPDNMARLLRHLTARQYGRLMGTAHEAAVEAHLASYATFLLSDFGPALLYVLLGFITLGERPRLRQLHALSALPYLLFVVTYGQSGTYHFLIPVVLLLSVLSACGLAWMVRRLTVTSSQRVVAFGLGPALVTAWIVVHGLMAYPAVNMRGNYHAPSDVLSLLREAPRGAAVITPMNDQVLFTLWYYLYAERRRPDLTIKYTWDYAKLLPTLPESQPVVTLFPPHKLPEGYYFEPVGPFGYIKRGQREPRFLPQSTYYPTTPPLCPSEAFDPEPRKCDMDRQDARVLTMRTLAILWVPQKSPPRPPPDLSKLGLLVVWVRDPQVQQDSLGRGTITLRPGCLPRQSSWAEFFRLSGDVKFDWGGWPTEPAQRIGSSGPLRQMLIQPYGIMVAPGVQEGRYVGFAAVVPRKWNRDRHPLSEAETLSFGPIRLWQVADLSAYIR